MQKLKRGTDIWGKKAILKAGNDLGFNKECGGSRTEVVQSRTCFTVMTLYLCPETTEYTVDTKYFISTNLSWWIIS